MTLMGGELERSFLIAEGRSGAVGKMDPTYFQTSIANLVMDAIRRQQVHIGDFYPNGSHRYLSNVASERKNDRMLETSTAPAHDGKTVAILLEAEDAALLMACEEASAVLSDELGRQATIVPTNVGADLRGNQRAFHMNFELPLSLSRGSAADPSFGRGRTAMSDSKANTNDRFCSRTS